MKPSKLVNKIEMEKWIVSDTRKEIKVVELKWGNNILSRRWSVNYNVKKYDNVYWVAETIVERYHTK